MHQESAQIQVLIVDDEIDICFLLSGIIKKKNLKTFYVSNLRDAAFEIEEKNPAILFIDNHLPDGYGVNFIPKIKLTHPETKIVMITVLVAMLFYATIPTLRNRIQYVVYDFSNYSTGNVMPGYNDAARWLSMKAGYQIMQTHPLYGVGFGDMYTEIDQWHQINHPNSFAYERFYPANEWLVYGTGSGWAGMICFAAGFFLLLYATTSKNILSVILSVVSIIPFLIDDSLEGQYGVLLLAFIAFFGQQILPDHTPTNE